MSMREKLDEIIASGFESDLATHKITDAVLDALMEPTEGMMISASQQEYAGESGGENCNLEVGDYIASIVWRSMISAAKDGK